MTVTRVVLVRHGRTRAPAGVCVGAMDVDLDDEGAAGSFVLAGRLRDEHPGAVCVSSDLVRCRRLAAQAADEVRIDRRLREQHFGAWEGRTWTSIGAEDPQRRDAVWSDYAHTAAPGGETLAEVQARALLALEEASGRAADRPLVVVTHAGVIRALLAAWLHVPLNHALRLAPDLLGMTEVDLHPEGAVLRSFNLR